MQRPARDAKKTRLVWILAITSTAISVFFLLLRVIFNPFDTEIARHWNVVFAVLQTLFAIGFWVERFAVRLIRERMVATYGDRNVCYKVENYFDTITDRPYCCQVTIACDVSMFLFLILFWIGDLILLFSSHTGPVSASSVVASVSDFLVILAFVPQAVCIVLDALVVARDHMYNSVGLSEPMLPTPQQAEQEDA